MILAPITAILTADSPELQGPEFGQGGVGLFFIAHAAPISSFVSRHPAPRGAEDRESGCVLSSSDMPDPAARNFESKFEHKECA